MKQTNKIELAYLAGIVDGEGCITITVAKGSKCKFYQLRLSVHNTNFDLMNWIIERFGGKLMVHTKKVASHKQRYDWLVRGQRAVEVVRLICPFMVIKRKQAEVALRWLPKFTMNPSYRQELLEEIQKLNNWRGMDGKAGVQLQRLSVRDSKLRIAVCNSPICKDDKLAEAAEMTARSNRKVG